jgi:hypothetical protein
MFELDSDGYPTQETLDYIENWRWTDVGKIAEFKELFDGIEKIWYTSNWGWREEESPHEIFASRLVMRYYISTGGWSGNESIIHAMENNIWIWPCTWVESRRGGHHILERPLDNAVCLSLLQDKFKNV